MIEKIGRYEIRGFLGKGGMATVYRAYDPSVKREVAIKLMSTQIIGDKDFRLRFGREAQIIASLEHPAIVPVYDFGEEAGQPFLVMRLMTGGTLGDKLRQGPLALADASRTFARLSAALDAAHQKGIIHRDLKPANVLFDRWDEAYLADFGIVKLAADDAMDLTQTGTSLGTPSYMSPEQAQGTSDLDSRSDIYSLGVILFEMLTGQRPYQGNSAMSVALKHVTAPIPEITQFNANLPAQAQLIISRALAKQPAGRYARAKDMSAQLSQLVQTSGEMEAVSADTVTQIASVGTTLQDRRPPQQSTSNSMPVDGKVSSSVGNMTTGSTAWSRRRLAIGLTLVFGAVLSLVLALSAFVFFSARSDSDVVSTSTPNSVIAAEATDSSPISPATSTATNEPASATAIPTQKNTEIPPTPTLLPITPTATQIPFASAGITLDGVTIPVDLGNVDSMTEISHYGRGTAVDVAYSRDGSRLAAATSTGVFVYETEGYELLNFIPSSSRPFAVDISSDGSTIVVGLVNARIELHDADSGEVLATLSGHATWITDLSFSPDGSLIASASSDQTVRIWDAEDGTLLQTISGHTEIVRTVAFSHDGRSVASGG